LDIDEVRFRESVTLYPNPATNQITFSYTGSETLKKAIITGVNGKALITVDVSEFNRSRTLDIQRLAKGMYFLKINSNRNVIVRKFLVR
jgi:hypothetical protein